MMYISFGEDVRVCLRELCWFSTFDIGSSERRDPPTPGRTTTRSPPLCHTVLFLSFCSIPRRPKRDTFV